MKDIFAGYKAIAQGIVGVIAISPALALAAAVATLIVKYIWKLIVVIW